MGVGWIRFRTNALYLDGMNETYLAEAFLFSYVSCDSLILKRLGYFGGWKDWAAILLLQNVRETQKKIVTKCRGESFARCRIIV